ncbi:MAG: hypothetical protein QXN46_01190, partial [Candidatus Woesearchaeota archaeon]
MASNLEECIENKETAPEISAEKGQKGLQNKILEELSFLEKQDKEAYEKITKEADELFALSKEKQLPYTKDDCLKEAFELYTERRDKPVLIYCSENACQKTKNLEELLKKQFEKQQIKIKSVNGLEELNALHGRLKLKSEYNYSGIIALLADEEKTLINLQIYDIETCNKQDFIFIYSPNIPDSGELSNEQRIIECGRTENLDGRIKDIYLQCLQELVGFKQKEPQEIKTTSEEGQSTLGFDILPKIKIALFLNKQNEEEITKKYSDAFVLQKPAASSDLDCNLIICDNLSLIESDLQKIYRVPIIYFSKSLTPDEKNEANVTSQAESKKELKELNVYSKASTEEELNQIVAEAAKAVHDVMHLEEWLPEIAKEINLDKIIAAKKAGEAASNFEIYKKLFTNRIKDAMLFSFLEAQDGRPRANILVDYMTDMLNRGKTKEAWQIGLELQKYIGQMRPAGETDTGREGGAFLFGPVGILRIDGKSHSVKIFYDKKDRKHYEIAEQRKKDSAYITKSESFLKRKFNIAKVYETLHYPASKDLDKLPTDIRNFFDTIKEYACENEVGYSLAIQGQVFGPTLSNVLLKINENYEARRELQNDLRMIKNAMLEVYFERLVCWNNNIPRTKWEKPKAEDVKNSYQNKLFEILALYSKYAGVELTENQKSLWKESVKALFEAAKWPEKSIVRKMDASTKNVIFNYEKENITFDELLKVCLSEGKSKEKVKDVIRKHLYHVDLTHKHSHFLEDFYHLVDSYEFSLGMSKINKLYKNYIKAIGLKDVGQDTYTRYLMGAYNSLKRVYLLPHYFQKVFQEYENGFISQTKFYARKSKLEKEVPYRVERVKKYFDLFKESLFKVNKNGWKEDVAQLVQEVVIPYKNKAITLEEVSEK